MITKQKRKLCTIMIGLILACPLMAWAAIDINSLELPQPDFGLEWSEELQQDLEEAILNAGKTKYLEKKVAYHLDFIKKYPLAHVSLIMRGRVGVLYTQMDRFEDARNIINDAKLVAGTNGYVNMLDVIYANVDMADNKLQQAETTLLSVMNRPAPNFLEDRHTVEAISFLAPIFLADVYARTNRAKEADQLLKKCSELALTLTRQNPNIDWLPSLFTRACYERIRIAYGANSDISDSLPIVEEVRINLPEFAGQKGYANVRRMIAITDRHLATEKP